MKRVLALLASVNLFLVVIGCAYEYDIRLDKTYDNRPYQKRLDENLEKPADEVEPRIAKIFVRPPLASKGRSTSSLSPRSSPVSSTSRIPSSRIKEVCTSWPASRGRRHPTPKGADSPPQRNPPGDFTADVLDLLKSPMVPELSRSPSSNPRPRAARKGHSFKTLDLDLTAKQVKVYLYGEKTSPAQVALIFEYTKEELKNLSSRIDLCLGSFRVGRECVAATPGRTKNRAKARPHSRPVCSELVLSRCE